MVVAGPLCRELQCGRDREDCTHAEGLPSSVVGLLIEPRTADVFVASKCGIAGLVGPDEILHVNPSHVGHMRGHIRWLSGDVKTGGRHIGGMWDCQFGWGTGIT